MICLCVSISKIRHLVVVANVTPEQLAELLLSQNGPITKEQLRENLKGVQSRVLANKPKKPEPGGES